MLLSHGVSTRWRASQPPELALNKLERGGGALAAQRAETKRCRSLCALIIKQQESVRGTSLTLQLFCFLSLVFADRDLLAAISIRPWKCFKVHLRWKKMNCAAPSGDLACL